MKRIAIIVLVAAAAAVLSACTPPAANAPANAANGTNSNANANVNANRPVAAAPSKETLMSMEKQAWEAWKNKDQKFFEGMLSANYVGFGREGRQDKAASVKSLGDPTCEVKSYALSDEQMQMLGADVAVLTFKAAQDYSCGGRKGPSNVWAASVYTREGDTWKSAFYAETPVEDPNAAPPKAAPPAVAGKPASDPLTQSLMAVETQAWEAWKNRDPKAMEAITTSGEFTYYSGQGRRNKEAALKAWSEPKCEGLAYTFSDAQAVQLSKDVALATYKADVKGSCDGRPSPPTIWVASFNVKEGDNWRNAFYMDWNR